MKDLISLGIYAIQVILPIIMIIITFNCFKGLLRIPILDTPLIILFNKTTKKKIPIIYWENSIGRCRSSDIVLDSLTVSRNHAALFRRDKGWFVSDTNSKSGVEVNGNKIEKSTLVGVGDIINVGGIELVLQKAESSKSKISKIFNKNKNKVVSPEAILFLVMIFHLLSAITACFASESFNSAPAIAFAAVTGLEWVCFFINKYGFRRICFELESLGILLSGIGIILISSVDIREAYNQMIAMAIGIGLFFSIVMFIKNPDRAMKIRPYIALFAVLLFVFNIVFGKVRNGSQNWVVLNGISLQPSELIKIAFVFVGASTLERLQTAKNLTGFILFSAICLGALFLMGDFGTACIFFITFLIIAFMRSGSIRTIILICVAAIMGGLMILKFKPYIIDRFLVWRHVWDHVNGLGYQQTRVLTYLASGGLFGVGIGRGCLRYVFASKTDLIFGMLCEEEGVILAILVVLSVMLIAIYARRASVKSRSAFYSIASCASAGMLVFQMSLNVFGATDILPLTGVTLPFVSLGGSSMICVWGVTCIYKGIR